MKFLFVLFVGFLIILAGMKIGTDIERANAVKAQAARWVNDDSGYPKFEYIKAN
jgi:hypothetical protein